MRTVPRTTVLVVTAVIVLAVFAVLAGDLAGGDPAAARSAELVIEGWEIEPGEVTLPADGPVTLVLVNRNDYTYHLAFGRDAAAPGSDRVGYGEDLLAGVDVQATPPSALIAPTDTARSVTIDLPARSEVRLEMTLPSDHAGTWTVGCYRGRGCDAQLVPTATLTVTS